MASFAGQLNSADWFQELRGARPIRAALLLAIFTKFDALFPYSVNDGPKQQAPATVPTIRADVLELAGWLLEPGAGQTQEDMLKVIADWTQASRERGFSGLETARLAISIQENWNKPQTGRPASRKTLAVLALDLKLTEPRLTWDALTARICPCGKKEHDIYCREAIRQEVQVLKRVLKKHGIAVPSPDHSFNRRSKQSSIS